MTKWVIVAPAEYAGRKWVNLRESLGGDFLRVEERTPREGAAEGFAVGFEVLPNDGLSKGRSTGSAAIVGWFVDF
jgi:hypothetical protein